MMKKALKITGIVFVLVFLFNIMEPLIHKKTDESWMAETYSQWNEEKKKERVKSIDDNQEALLWRLRMIENAKEEIILSTFDLRPDEGGKDVMSALYDAAQRGVKVKLLVDGIYEIPFLLRSDEYKALVAHENVEAGKYNPIRFKNIFRFNYRMHDKYLITDRNMYMLGGRNTNDIFLGNYQKWINVDRDIFVCDVRDEEGSSLHQLLKYFESIWMEPCVDKSTPHISENRKKEQYEMFEARYQNLKQQYPDIVDFNRWEEETFVADRVQLLANETHAGQKEPRVLDMMTKLAQEHDEIMIQTPYVICNSYMYDSLKKMSDGSELKILLNAVEKGSNPWGCTDYMNQKEKILSTGADVYEVMNTHAVHTKTALFGDTISLVGSYNLDMRSTYLDTELMLMIDCEELNDQIREVEEDYIQKSKEVLSDGTVTEGAEYVQKELTTGKKFFYQVLRIVIRPFRHLL